jgi:hypothetical protein
VRFADSTVTASGFHRPCASTLTTLRANWRFSQGNAHLERGSAMALDLHGGESVALNGADPSRYNLSESIEPDSWDTWNSDRDEALSADAAARTGASKKLSRCR